VKVTLGSLKTAVMMEAVVTVVVVVVVVALLGLAC
jgi:hypothetical protein